MERIVIQGGRGLRGTVFVSGAKNAVLKLLVSALMTEELCTFRNVPRLADVTNMMHVLRGLGAQIEMTADRTVQVQAR
ncbi:MAG: UDP-N-acetylglucosamine 1-carboxyvinyltransferase, partial [Firmicutes bacterium]|nr:UDP-N-acetylglucosamine 1-carboxyvinyltransferase [Bacillota bacterium]